MTEPTLTDEQAAALRKPFPPSAVGKLPKGGIMLDYVGHAATTDRLLSVDPLWTWEPMATDDRGLPALDAAGNLWIRLTVCGVTRIGVGGGKSAKEAMGDAIRNAAMRFGVALDLWSKEELEQASGPVARATEPPPDPPPAKPKAEVKATAKQVQRIGMLATDLGLDRDQKLAGIAATIGREVASSKDLTTAEASQVIDRMQAKVDAAQAVTA